MIISNCNSELCGRIGFRKELLVGNGIEKVVPTCGINYYYKLISRSSRRNKKLLDDGENDEKELTKKQKEKGKDWYKIITLKSNSDCIIAFSARIKVCNISQMETIIALKLVQEPQTRPEARILVDSNFRISESNNQSMNVFDLYSPQIKKLGYSSIRDLLPGLKYAAKDRFPNPRKLKDLLKLKHIRFSSFLVKRRKFKNQLKQRVMNTISRKKVSIKHQFYLRVMRTEDSRHYLLSIWKDSSSQIRENQDESIEEEPGYSFPPSSTSTQSIENEAFFRNEKIKLTSLIDSYLNPRSRFEFRVNKDAKIEGLLPNPPIRQTNKRKKNHTLRVESQSQETINTQDHFEDVVNSIMVKYNIRSTKVYFSSPLTDYGCGIITRRLVDGNLKDVYDEDKSSSANSEKSSGSRTFDTPKGKNITKRKRIQNKRTYYVEGSSTRISSSEDMERIVQRTRKATPAVRFFCKFSILFFMVVAATVSVYLYIDSFQISALSQLINLNRYSVMTLVGQQFVQARMVDICMINSGINPLLGTERANQKDQYKKESIEYFGEWVERLRKIHTRFESMETSQPELALIKQEREKPVVPLRYESSFQNYSFNHAMHQVISVLHNIKNKDPKNITFDNKDVDFVLYNLNNGITDSTVKLMLVTTNAKTSFQMKVKSEVMKRTLLLLLPFLILVFVAFYTILLTLKNREAALGCFYSFEEQHMKFILRNSEEFLEFVQNVDAEMDRYTGIEDLNVLLSNRSAEKKQKTRKQKGGKKRVIRNGLNRIDKHKALGRKKLYTGKRKKRLKGGLLTICGFWQILIFGLIFCNLAICYYGYYQKEEVVAEGFQASNLMYYISISMSLTSGMWNTFVTAMLDPKNTARGIPVLGTAKFYDRVVLFYLDKIYEVKNQ